MEDFFTAKISRTFTPPMPSVKEPKEAVSSLKVNTMIKLQSLIEIDDSPQKVKVNDLEKPLRNSERETKQPTKESKKEEYVILIEDDDEDSNCNIKQSSYVAKAITTDLAQKEINTQLSIDNKRIAVIDLDEVVPNTAEVQKKVKLDNQQVGSTSDKAKLALTDNLINPYIPVRGTQPEYILSGRKSKLFYRLTSVIAIDCEMVIVDYKLHELARCSIVDYNGHVLFDKLIVPKGRITNYLTFVSGITANKLKDAKPYSAYRSEIIKILKGRIIVGHSIKNDFDALHYYPEKKYVRDITHYKGFKTKGGTPSLKKMAADHLGWQIQDGQHNSVEDARATLALYRKIEKEWEKEIKDANYGMVPKLADIKKSYASVM